MDPLHKHSAYTNPKLCFLFVNADAIKLTLRIAHFKRRFFYILLYSFIPVILLITQLKHAPFSVALMGQS